MFELSGVPSFIVALPSGSGAGARRVCRLPAVPRYDASCDHRGAPVRLLRTVPPRSGSPPSSSGALPFTRDPPREAGHGARRKQQPLYTTRPLVMSFQSASSVPGVGPAHVAEPAGVIRSPRACPADFAGLAPLG